MTDTRCLTYSPITSRKVCTCPNCERNRHHAYVARIGRLRNSGRGQLRSTESLADLAARAFRE